MAFEFLGLPKFVAETVRNVFKSTAVELFKLKLDIVRSGGFFNWIKSSLGIGNWFSDDEKEEKANDSEAEAPEQKTAAQTSRKPAARKTVVRREKGKRRGAVSPEMYGEKMQAALKMKLEDSPYVNREKPTPSAEGKKVEAFFKAKYVGYDSSLSHKATYESDSTKHDGLTVADIKKAEAEAQTKLSGKNPAEVILARESYAKVAHYAARQYDVPPALVAANGFFECGGVFDYKVGGDAVKKAGDKDNGKFKSGGMGHFHWAMMPDLMRRESDGLPQVMAAGLGPFVKDNPLKMERYSSILYDMMSIAALIRHMINQFTLGKSKLFPDKITHSSKLTKEQLVAIRAGLNVPTYAIAEYCETNEGTILSHFDDLPQSKKAKDAGKNYANLWEEWKERGPEYFDVEREIRGETVKVKRRNFKRYADLCLDLEKNGYDHTYGQG